MINNTKGPLIVVPMVSLTFLPNCPCFYRWFLWVWCHCMTAYRAKVFCKIQYLSTLLNHMTGCYFAWLWLVHISHMTSFNCHCSFQLNCLHQVVLIYWKQENSFIIAFDFCSIGSKCPIFHKIGNARGVDNPKIMVLGEYCSWKTPLRLDNIGKKCRVPFIYTIWLLLN